MTEAFSIDGYVGEHPMLQLLDEIDERIFSKGDVVNGTIMMVGSNEILIDVGGKSEGILSPRELGRMTKEDIAALTNGDEVEVLIVNPNDRSGNLIVSMSQARIGQDWDEAEELFAAGTLFEAEVSGHNRGGLIVYMGGVRGFVPASQIDRRRAFKREEIDGSPTSPLATLVGAPLTFKIIELDRRGNRLILSELAAMRERRKVSKAQLLDELAEGQIKEGIVTSLADFGAFVDIGGADGLVHLSELTWGRVSHPKEVLELGEKVKVKVISVDRERKRIGLSLKALAPEPWSTVEERYVVGEVVEAEITRLADFGAFARLDEEIEGLIHVTELSDVSQTPEEIVTPGEKVAVRIIRIDPERKRIGLSLKRADGAYDALGLDFDDDLYSDDGDATIEPSSPTEEQASEPNVSPVAEVQEVVQEEVQEQVEVEAPLEETPEPEAV
jgi:small subunit ribosomal protein S1